MASKVGYDVDPIENVGGRYKCVTMLKSKSLLDVKSNLIFYEETHQHDKNIVVTFPSK